jgi:hypothetical protein
MRRKMKHLIRNKQTWKKMRIAIFVLSFSLALISCATVDPAKVDVELKKSPPKAKITSFTQSLGELGLMTEIYATGPLKIQSNPIGDNTGTSGATGGEIPRDITEMLKSSLNSIGGNVIFIPYDPAFIQNQMVTGYSSFEGKIIPDVIISGGITEFDRGLETRGDNTDVAAGAEWTGLPDWLPSKETKLRYEDSGKAGLARITLDFNLLDFQTMSGIAKMNTVNSMEVSKALAGKELGITLFGQTFGRKGTVKKVQGRHAAVRLLVELSMIQIVGKHLVLPYWNLLGEEAQPDRIVMQAAERYYYSLSNSERVANVQEWLYLHGHDVPQSGRLDNSTRAALKAVTGGTGSGIDLQTFLKVYTTIPINQATLGRRNMLANLYSAEQEAAVESAVATAEAPPTAQPQAKKSQPAPAPAEAAAEPPPRKVEKKRQPKKKAAVKKTTRRKKKKGIGRILSDDEW